MNISGNASNLQGNTLSSMQSCQLKIRDLQIEKARSTDIKEQEYLQEQINFLIAELTQLQQQQQLLVMGRSDMGGSNGPANLKATA